MKKVSRKGISIKNPVKVATQIEAQRSIPAGSLLSPSLATLFLPAPGKLQRGKTGHHLKSQDLATYRH
jgi:hypothetical protein